MTRNALIICSLLAVGGGAALGLGDDSTLRVTLRLVVLTENDGADAAVSLRDVEPQVAVLRNDAARQGVAVAVKTVKFMPDSARRHVDDSALARDADTSDAGFANAKDEIVVYVTSLGKAASTPYLVRSGANSSLLPVIVIDASEFGGQMCEPNRTKPCRMLSRALGEVLSIQTAPALRSAGEVMKQSAMRSEE